MSDLLILGASARAAAQSARRAGFTPHAVDLFNDRDLLAVADCRRCDLADYPNGLERLAAEFGPMPWLYTGGLENHPDLVGRIATVRELLGNGPEQLNAVRGEAAWQRMLDAGIAMPRTILNARRAGGVSPLLTDRTQQQGADPPRSPWLRKAFASSGGLGVGWADELEPRPGTYLQEFVAGRVYGAVFRSRPGETRLVGVSEQLVGEDWLHAAPFQYAGSIGPYRYSLEFADELMTEAHSPLNACETLDGVWGADVLSAGPGRVLLLDINPRYPASAEVLELATGVRVLDGVKRRPGLEGVIGKAVYYAPHAFRFPEYDPFDLAVAVAAADPWALPEFADLPAAGTMMEAGQPVLTLFAHAAESDDCLSLLKARAAELDALFGHTP